MRNLGRTIAIYYYVAGNATVTTKTLVTHRCASTRSLPDGYSLSSDCILVDVKTHDMNYNIRHLTLYSFYLGTEREYDIGHFLKLLSLTSIQLFSFWKISEVTYFVIPDKLPIYAIFFPFSFFSLLFFLELRPYQTPELFAAANVTWLGGRHCDDDIASMVPISP